MAKRKTTFDNNDDDKEEEEEQQRPVYIETSLNTHLVLQVYPSDTVTTLKKKFLLEHADAYPDIGEIQVTAFKVKQKGSYFRLANSMLVKTAFYGVVKPWFLYADAVVTQRACVNQTLAIIPHRGQPTLFSSFKPGETETEGNNKEDHFGTNSHNTENVLQLKDLSAKASPSRKKKKSRVLNFDNEDENDDVQSTSLLGSYITPVDDDQGKAFGSGSKSTSGSELQKDPHLNCKGSEGPATEGNVKNVGDGTELKDSVDDESFQSGSPAKKKRKVVNNYAQELSLLGAKSLLSDPCRAASKPETLVNNFDGEDMQKSRLVDSNAMPSEVLKTSKASKKRKIEERDVNCEVPSSEASREENLKDTEHHACDASAIATDAAAEVEAKSFQSLDMTLGVVGNNNQPEGTTASLAEYADTENSGLANGNGVKKAKEVDGGGTRGTHHNTSSEVPDKMEDSVAPLDSENTIRDSEPDNMTIAEGIKATNETVELASTAKKKKAKKGKNSLADRPDFMSIENNHQNVGNEGACGEIAPHAEEAEAENVVLRSTAKKKVKKGKSSIAEKPELTNLESDHQDVNDGIVSSGPAEDQNKSGLTNEGNSGENAPQTEGTEATNENMEFGGTTKKLKKGKNSVAERSKLTNKEDNHLDVCNDIDSSGPAEDQKKDGLMNAPETDVTKATNENVEPGATANKKKAKKGKTCVAEKPDLPSMENNHQDMNNDAALNRPAEDLNKDGLINECSSIENAPQTEVTKATNENMELGTTSKKKKVKKGKNFLAEKPDLTSMENGHQDVNNDTVLIRPAEDMNKDGLKDGDHIGEDARGTKSMNQTVELASPAKKKKAKKGKNFFAEKPDLTSMVNDHQDMNNDIFSGTPVEDLRNDGLKNADNIGEDAPETEGTKAMNQTVELAGTAKKKKAKKGNNSVADKPELTSMENDHQDVNYDTVSSKPAEDLDKDGLKNESYVSEDVPQIEGAKAINQTVELASTIKKKKAKKGKNSVAEKPNLASMENDHQGVGNEGGGRELAPQAEAEEAEARNENVELGSMAKKKKVKNFFAEKPTVSSMGNTTDLVTDICSDGHAEADKRECITHTDSKTATVSCQEDGWEADDDKVRQTVPQLLQPAESNKAGENMEIKSHKPKWIQKKQTLSAKDPLESPPEHHFGDKTRCMDGPRMANGDLSSNSDNNDGKQQMELGEDHREKNTDFPLPKVSAGLADGRKLDKPRASKQKAKKLDGASSVDTSASGQSMISSKTRLRNRRTSQDVTQLQNDERDTENMKDTEPPQVNKPEDNVESKSDKTKKMTPKKQTALENPPQLSMKQHLEDKMGEMASPKLVEVDPLTKSNINDATHQSQVSLGEGLHEELNGISPAGDSSGLAEMRSLNKPQASKQEAKKGGIPLSMDTSSNGPSLCKLKKSKGYEITSHDVTGLQKDCTEQKHNQSMPQPSAELPVSSRERMMTRARRAELVATVKNQKDSAKKIGLVSASIHCHKKPSEASSLLSSSSDRMTHQETKAKELHKKPDGSHVDSRKSRNKKMGVNASAQRKGLSATSGAIFGDGSGSSSSGGAAMDYSVKWRHQETKSKELHKKPYENHVDTRRPSDKKMGRVSASTQGKASLGTSGAIFGDESSSSSSDRENMDDSASSTRTPSDNSSSSDYSEGESKGDVMTPEHDTLKCGGAKNNQKSNTPGGNKLTFESILRSSSRFRKAKQMASQSQFDDSESQPGEFVPDSQP